MPAKRGNVRRLPTRLTEDQELTVILNDMPDEEVRCRMRGRHRYAMDSVLPGQAWPDVIRAWPGKLGAFRIEDPCLDCELAWRVIETGVSGDMTGDLVITLHYDAQWVTVPQGYGRTGPRRMRSEYNRRGGKRQSAQLSKVVSRTANEERRLARQRAKEAREAAEGAPQVRFTHAGAS